MKLSDIRLVDAGARQHQALMRLTLKVMGETHRLLLPFQGWLTGLVRSSADDEGNANGAQLIQAMTTIEGRWSKVMADWVKLLEAARIQAASIPFGLLVVQHNAYLTGVKRPVTEAIDEEDTRPIVALWQQRRSRLLEVAQRKTYGDGMNLNQRIWRLENGGLANIRNMLRTSMAERTNAFTLASLLEEQIGAEDKLPAWTDGRLYRMTPKERAKSEGGLLRGPDEKSKGVAYSALRLARTELQNANHAMSTEIARHAPWVTGRKVTLSAGHPKIDICDQWAAGGPYDKGEEILSLHPNCVTPGQAVNTERGMVSIEQIRAGDMVLTHSGKYSRVKTAWSNPHDGLVYEISTPCGQFELTGNHPVLLRRGWVNAEFVQPGDEVLYAGVNIGPDLPFGVAEYMPTPTSKKGVAPDIMVELLEVPSAVAFDGDLNTDQGKVYEVTPDLVFPFVGNASAVEGGNHGDFQGARGRYAPVAVSQQHGHEARVTGSLRLRNFSAYIWAASRVVFAKPIKTLAGLLHFLAGRLRTGAVIFRPCSLDRIAPISHGDLVHRQQFAESTVGQAVTPEDFGCRYLFFEIDLAEELGDRDSVFGFNAQALEFGAGQVVLSEVGAGKALHAQAANGASNHNSVLSLDPDVWWGAESGNSVVSGVITPAQAPLNYTTVTGVNQRHYSGPVYNMEVDGEHSYTVNGAIVHNCMCYYTDVLMDRTFFTQQIGDWLAGENDFLDDYSQWLGARDVITPLPWEMSVAESLELWLSTGQSGHAVALGLNE